MSYHIRSICMVAVIVGVTSCVADPQSADCLSSSSTCIKNAIVPMKDWQYCEWFCTCQNNRFVPRKCSLGRSYNPALQKCFIGFTDCIKPVTTTKPTTKPTEPTPTTENPTPTSENPTEPTKPSSKPTEPNTPAPTTISTSTTPDTTTTPAKSSPKPREPCSKDEEGKKKAASDCHQFQVCTEGFWGDPQTCTYGYYFNSDNSDCEFNTVCVHCSCV